MFRCDDNCMYDFRCMRTIALCRSLSLTLSLSVFDSQFYEFSFFEMWKEKRRSNKEATEFSDFPIVELLRFVFSLLRAHTDTHTHSSFRRIKQMNLICDVFVYTFTQRESREYKNARASKRLFSTQLSTEWLMSVWPRWCEQWGKRSFRIYISNSHITQHKWKSAISHSCCSAVVFILNIRKTTRTTT